jgi:glutaredoxin-like protein NrdH
MITVYTKAHCQQCVATKRHLDKRGIDYQLSDLEQDEGAAVEAQAYGYRELPIVVAGDDHWSGFRPDKLAALGGGE